MSNVKHFPALFHIIRIVNVCVQKQINTNTGTATAVRSALCFELKLSAVIAPKGHLRKSCKMLEQDFVFLLDIYIYIIVGSKVVQISREIGSIVRTGSNPPYYFLNLYCEQFFLVSSRLTHA